MLSAECHDILVDASVSYKSARETLNQIPNDEVQLRTADERLST
jgi:hypothetical protein